MYPSPPVVEALAHWFYNQIIELKLVDRVPGVSEPKNFETVDLETVDLENYLSHKTSELFDLQDKIILYDLTNTYFEGRKLHSHLAMFGNSKEKRKGVPCDLESEGSFGQRLDKTNRNLIQG